MCKFILSVVFLSNNFLIYSQDLVIDNGIFIEKPKFNDTFQSRYSSDNISYKLNKIYIYDYYFQDKLGSKAKFLKDENWSFNNPLNLANDSSTNAITDIYLFVSNPLNFFSAGDSTYTQTVFNYLYITKDFCNLEINDIANNIKEFEETTGLIDNYKNLWIHPPRMYSFKILQLNPYPFYYLENQKKSWSWNLKVGGNYLDQRWINWNEPIEINTKYSRVKDQIIDTRLGKLECRVVSGESRFEYDGKFVKTFLISYYNKDYGFVKLDYTNVNGTKIVMELKKLISLHDKIINQYPSSQSFENKCCLEYFSEKLFLNNDSSFKYRYSDKNFIEQHSGKYKILGDTLFLYDYSIGTIKENLLIGNEKLDLNFKDSIKISFINAKNLKPFLPKVFINGKCVKYSSNRGLYYMIPKQTISKIMVKDGMYIVKDNKSNDFVITYEPKIFTKNFDRIANISKCLISGDSLIRINCDGNIDRGYILK